MKQGHNRPPFMPEIPGMDLKTADVPTAIIYRPAKSATQSGPRPRHWILQFEPHRPAQIDPLMGWTASDDAFRPIRMRFPDRDSAVAYAVERNWNYIVLEDRPRKRNLRSGTAQGALLHGLGGREVTQSLFAEAQKLQGRNEDGTLEPFDPVLEADLESFPASDPPAWVGATLPSRG